jgi:hypothetical protein
MPKINLSGMTVEALMDLRKRVEAALFERRSVLEKQLEWMDSTTGGERVARGGRGSALKGRKVPPKYRCGEGRKDVVQCPLDAANKVVGVSLLS